ncbi:SpoIID/LytB domain-containing protein [Clostridium sp.]|uniref:SpoIID/LytB domain-containing protein n=1 Tax=Clostridium sp. TaxID=1506 RepID=UPI002FC86454
MKKIFIIYMVVFLMALFIEPAYAFNSDVKESGLDVKEVRVGLKGLASSKLTLTINGEYTVNNKRVKDQVVTITYKNKKLLYNGSLESVIDIKPSSKESYISAKYKGASHNFEGRFIIRPSKGEVLPINLVSIESYIKGVLPYEMSSSYPVEALKAQAVSARNYAVTSIDKHRNEKFDVCDGIHCQVYKGVHRDCPKIEGAVESTRGEVLMEGDDVVKAFFYSSNGGVTESSKDVWNSEFSYLLSQVDKFDTDKWTRELSTKDIDKILKKKGYLKSYEEFKGVKNVVKGEGGRVKSLVLNINQENKSVKNLVIDREGTRIALGLKSNYYNITFNKSSSTYTIVGGGFGHGVGLSQLGAKNRALNGQGYRDILSFYYKGTNIKKIP